MREISFAVGAQPVSIQADDTDLIEVCARYFAYYQPPSGQPEAHASLRIHLRMETTLPAAGACLSTGAVCLSDAGNVSLWRDDTGETEQFWFVTPVALFRAVPAAGFAEAIVIPRALEIPALFANTFLLFPLLLLLRARGFYHLHAAGVVSPAGRLYVICGAQRAGKSSLATALGLSGWRPVSDDTMLLANLGGQPAILAFKKQFHLSNDLLGRWPGLDKAISRQRDHDRSSVAALEFFGAETLAGQPFAKIDCLLLPEIADRNESRLTPAPLSEGMMRMEEQNMFRLWPAHNRRHHELIGALLRGAACYRLESGRDIYHDPLCAARLLTQAESPLPATDPESPRQPGAGT
ncbi:MAG: hypothetical protein ACKV2V_30450 [Blastocatellia bacterium]